MFYLLSVLVLAVATFRTRFSRIASDRLFYFTFVILFVVVAFRFDVGCDWVGYYLQWEKIEQGDLALRDQRSPGWLLLVRAIQELGLPYVALNVVAAIIFFVCVFVFSQTQQNRLAFLFFLIPVLMVNMPMSGIRQAIAIGIVLFAFRSFMHARIGTFLLWIALAASFHASAAILLFLTPFVRGSLGGKQLLFAMIFAIPTLALLATTESAEVATSRYIDADREALGAVFRVSFLALTGFAYLLIISRIWRRRSPEDHKLVFLGAIAMIGLLLILPLSTVIADRLSYYFVPLQAMVFSKLAYLENRHSPQVLTLTAFAVTAVFFAVWTATSGHFASCYVPYQSWLFGYPEPIDRTFY